MKNYYDFVYLTNTPSFYKLNLCNRIAKKKTLLLVLYGYGSEAVNTVLTVDSKNSFDYVFINEGDSNKRPHIKTFFRLLQLMRSIKCKKILFSGWSAVEYNLYSLISPKEKNVIICESSIFDVSFKGIKGWIKKIVIDRMSAALPSGIPHNELFKSIGFAGPCYNTGSVGIFNKGKRNENKQKSGNFKYLYVGRLVSVKNIQLIIEEFNENGKPLTIVGQGELEPELKNMAKNNISFIGFVENEQLGAIYQNHDVFILPSTYEPWGLVVEEALYWGLPCIVSSKVGSSIDMIKNLTTGEIFEDNNKMDLHRAIKHIENNYHMYKRNVDTINWELRDKEQVETYWRLIE